MDSIKYELDKENREKKSIARNAAKRKNGSKSKKCSLPSDRLTPKQLKALNGEVFTFAMNKPCKFEDMVQANKDLIEEYLYTLVDRFNVTTVCVTRILGIPEPTFYKWAADNQIERPVRRSKFMSAEDSQAWNNWLAQFGWKSGYQKPELYPVSLNHNIDENDIEKEESAEDGLLGLMNSFSAAAHNQKELDILYRSLSNILAKRGSISITVNILT